jgi:ABC-type Fe3+-hydroxamate transport system substrate-binding protein
MSLFIDQTGRTIQLETTPQRIISLVPSQTELLADLGLDIEVTGITKFCIHPENWFRHKPKIGGTKNCNLELIHSLQPDLILANKEENDKMQVEELARHYPVWISDIASYDDALAMILQVGEITNKEKAAFEIVDQIRLNFSSFHPFDFKTRVAYLIWKNPYMTVGGGTFIHSMLEKIGFENVFKDLNRYPEITIDMIGERNTDLIMLSSEPYPFREKHLLEMQQLLPQAKIILVDGEIFSWYGSRMLQAPAYFSRLQHILK